MSKEHDTFVPQPRCTPGGPETAASSTEKEHVREKLPAMREHFAPDSSRGQGATLHDAGESTAQRPPLADTQRGPALEGRRGGKGLRPSPEDEE